MRLLLSPPPEARAGAISASGGTGGGEVSWEVFKSNLLGITRREAPGRCYAVGVGKSKGGRVGAMIQASFAKSGAL